MTERPLTFAERLSQHFGDKLTRIDESSLPLTIECAADEWLSVCRALRDDFKFEQMTDLCGVDYLSYGSDEWETDDVTSAGFSRGIGGEDGPGRFDWEGRPEVEMDDRFAAVVHLLSVANNQRLRVRCFATDQRLPVIPSLIDVWPAANWFEREAFDLYGIVFEGHPDLRRILTDYGFVGHPFRKDFPLIGNVEVRYDPAKGRVVYEPVSIEPRVLVPKVIREDSRYLCEEDEQAKQAQLADKGA